MSSKDWLFFGIILMIITVILTISIHSFEKDIIEKNNNMIVLLKNDEITFEEFQKKINEMKNDANLINDLYFWRDLAFYAGILHAFLSLYTFYKEREGIRIVEYKETKEEINPKDFHYAYAKLPKEKKVEKIQELKRR